MLKNLIYGDLYIINPDLNPFLGAHVLNQEELNEYSDFKIGVNKNVLKLRNECKNLGKDIYSILVDENEPGDYHKRLNQFIRWNEIFKYKFKPTSSDNVNYGSSSLLITCKVRSNDATLKIIKKDWKKIFITTNHFYTLNKKVRNLFSNLSDKKVTIIAFNKSDACVFNKRLNTNFEYVLVPPIVDKRFKNYSKKRNFDISSSGSISYIKGNKDIWNPKNRKFMYQGRMIIHRYNKKLKINSAISNVSPNFSQRLVKLKNRLFNKQIDWSKKKYYNFNLIEFLNDSLFFLCSEDIWGVLPLGGWEAMACGCILVLTEQTADEFYGFKSDENFICIGNEWTYDSLKKVTKKIRNLSPSEIKSLQTNSQKLFSKINSLSNEFWKLE